MKTKHQNQNPSSSKYHPTIESSPYIQRIKEVQSRLKDSEILLMFASSHKIRNRDSEYPFRQDSDFYYLTGYTESDGILVLTQKTSGMFCLPKDKEKEIWTGIRLGKDAIQKMLQLDFALDLSDWNKEKANLLTNKHTLYYFFGKDSHRDSELIQLARNISDRAREGKYGPERILEPTFLAEMRKKKSPFEIECIRNSAQITWEGFERLYRDSKPGMKEYELEAMLDSSYKRNGAFPGYNHIVASGKNACILHYNSNNDTLKEGDLVLVDSGAEKNLYTADVTRCFPAGKKFTPVQVYLYEVVLAAQKNAISMAKAKTPYSAIHDKTVNFFIDVLLDMKLLKGSPETIKEEGSYKKFYMHRTGHYLGLDVHDVGRYYTQKGESVLLEDNEVITIEPGLYFDPTDETIPEEFRGIGIRIEDDVRIHGNKPEILTAMIPKEIDEVEAFKND